MSSRSEKQHNLKVAELAYAAFNKGDLETLLKLAHTDIEVHLPPGQGVDPGTYHGHDGYRDWYLGWMEAFDNYQATPLDVQPVGDRHLVVLARQTATGKESGAPVEMDSGNMLEFRDGKIVALHLYPDKEAALAAAKEREAAPADE